MLTAGFAALAILACVAVVQARDANIRHQFINIYPAVSIAADSHSLVLDGQLDDWNPQAFVLMFGDADMREFYNLRLAMAYDDTGLWLATRVTDASPMLNKVDPIVDPFRGWDGDALQIRFVTDPALDHPLPADRLNTSVIKHLTMWYFTERHSPVLDVRHGMKFQNPQTYASAHEWMVYHRHDDGQGYDLEAHLPWSVLGVATPPQGGERWVMTVQPLWSNEAGDRLQHKFFDVIGEIGFHFQRPTGWGHGRFIAPADAAKVLADQMAHQAKLDQPAGRENDGDAGIAVTYTNSAKGYMSMAIYNPNGQIVRTLLAREPREAGQITEHWDGLDDDGHPAPAGTYVVKGLVHDGIRPRFVTSVHNSGEPTWVTSDGKGQWGADHGNPIAAVAGLDGWCYVAWRFNEKGHFLQGVDADGRKQWGADIPAGDLSGGATALAYHNGVVYVAKDGPGPRGGGLLAFDAATGRRLALANNQGALPITQWDNEARQAYYKNHGSRIFAYPHPRSGTEHFGLAGFGGNITAMAAGHDHLYVALLYENKIVAVNIASTQIDGHFDVPHPGGLAFDPATDQLYAISGQQVIVIDTTAAKGRHRTLIAEGLDHPTNLTLDRHGNLYVSVQGNQMQVRMFNADGQLLRMIGKEGGRPWVGRYDPLGMLMPTGICVTDRDMLWVMENEQSPKRVSVWDARTGQFHREYFGGAAYAQMMAPDPDQPEHVYLRDTRFIVDYDTGQVTPDATVYRRTLLPGPAVPGSQQGYGFMGSTFQLARYAGRTFAFNGFGGVFAVHDDVFKPLLYIGGPKDRTFPVFDVVDVASQRGNGVVWIDANGDAMVDDDETRIVDMSLRGNIRSFGGAFHPGAAFISARRIFKPQGLSPAGAPIYPRPEDAPPILTGDGPMAELNYWQDVWPSYKYEWAHWYAIAGHLERVQGKPTRHREGLYRFDRDGNIHWAYRRVVGHFGLEAPLSRVGDIYGAVRITGLIELPEKHGGEIIGLASYRGYFSFLSEDGLFIDQVGHDIGRGPRPAFDTFFIENFSGYFFRHPATGKVYLFAGDTDARILELQGWDTIRRIEGPSITVTSDQQQQIVAGLTASADPTASPTVLTITATPDGFTGGLDQLPASSIATIALADDDQARVALAYDASNLHLLADVPDTSPAQNRGNDWRFAFKSGDVLDVQLGMMNPDPNAKRRPQPGDVRVLIVPHGDGGELVAMWTRVNESMTSEPMRYESPTGEETFERVALLDGGKVTIHRRDDGYRLHATIPWAKLGLTAPQRGVTRQGDVGVLLSDADGSITTLRRYLFNKDTGIVMDIPNEVRVQSHQWGTLHFD